MKRQQQAVLVAGVLAIAFGLAGCSTTGASASASNSASGSEIAESSSIASCPAPSGTAGAMDREADPRTRSAMGMPNSTVTKIDILPRQGGSQDDSQGQGAESGAGARGSSGAGASTGSGGAGADRLYRITVRMDDGSTKVLTQEWTPSFSTGARVRVTNDMVER